MEIPNPKNFLPPTDNLYRFVALTGLILAVAGIIGISWAYHRYYSEANTQLLQIVSLQQQVYQYEKTPGNEKIDATNPNDPRVKTVGDAMKLIIMQLNGINGDFVDTKWTTNISLLIGIVMMLWGFKRWHDKLQRPQDELLLLQLEYRRARLKKAMEKVQRIIEK